MAPDCKSSLISTNDVFESKNGNAVAKKLHEDTVLNLDHGDPTMFESYWRKTGEKSKITFTGDESMSYFSDVKNICWFMEPKLKEAIMRLHNVVGNAVAMDDGHLVVGTGSSQLYQAALYALSSSNADQQKPVNVVCAVPYYSSYPEITDYLQSKLYKWAGDASTFDHKDEPYIELITSPNNPDGTTRSSVVVNSNNNNNNNKLGKLIHDFAYYWPQYTPITTAADHPIMLFTASKCTGHAGSRIGWAIVKDKEVAKKMIKFIELNTIGVSKESQLRTAKILGAISDSCIFGDTTNSDNNFFKSGKVIMSERWQRLKDVVKRSNGIFSLSEYPREYCNFNADFCTSHPAFAWVKCNEEIEDAHSLFGSHKIVVRSGSRFGSDPNHARLSMVCREEEFNLFLERLSAIKGVHI